MKKELYFALLFVTILLFTGCKKDIVDAPLQETNTNSKTDLSGDAKLSDTVTYEDGYRYITSNPYGLDNVNEQRGFSTKTQSKTTQTETNNIPTTQDSNNKEKNRIDKEDIFIKSHSLLKNTPFYTETIDNVKEKCLEKLDITYSEEKLNGYLTYYKGDGITYITTEDGSLYSIILTNNKYEFGCGLKVGLDENEISNLDISFRIYNKDEIGVDKKLNSYLLSYEIGPLSMFNFDTLYYYSATLYDENETESHVDVFTGRCMGIMAFMKDGKLIAVSTDWPNAN